MPNLVTIYCKNIKQFIQIPCGTSLLELYQQLNLQLPYPVIAARVNYKVQSLNFLIYKPKDIEFIEAIIFSAVLMPSTADEVIPPA